MAGSGIQTPREISPLSLSLPPLGGDAVANDRSSLLRLPTSNPLRALQRSLGIMAGPSFA